MKISLMAALLLCCSLAGCAKPSTPQDDERLAVANDMVDAWNTMEWDRMFDLFAEDGVLHSVMIDPIVGRETIRNRLSPLVNDLDRIELQIHNIGMVGDVVMIERVDDFVYKGKHSRVPVVGVLEISNGKVDEWREYYDKASLAAALDSGDQTATVSNDILELTKQLAIDWNAGYMDKYLDAYSEDAELSLLFGDRIIASKEELTELFTTSWTTEEEMGDFDTRQVGVRQVSPGTAIARGLFEHRFPHETVRGSFSHVWQKNNAGSWKIIHEHTSRGHVE